MPAQPRAGIERLEAIRTRFIELAGQINTDMPYHVVAAVASALNQRKKSLNGSKVLVLGVA